MIPPSLEELRALARNHAHRQMWYGSYRSLDIDDLAQEAWLAAWQACDRLVSEDKRGYAYLHRRMRGAILDAIRAEGEYRRHGASNTYEELSDDESDAEEPSMWLEARDLIEKAEPRERAALLGAISHGQRGYSRVIGLTEARVSQLLRPFKRHV